MAASLVIREVAPGDTAEIDAGMRLADRDEIIASHGPDTLATLDHGAAISTHCLVVEANGRLVCVMGVVPVSLLGGHGSPWMLGTDALDTLSRTLARVARRYFDEVARVYPVLENFVDVRNTASIRLLKWLGCSFDEPRAYGAAGLPFMRFERRSG